MRCFYLADVDRMVGCRRLWTGALSTFRVIVRHATDVVARLSNSAAERCILWNYGLDGKTPPECRFHQQETPEEPHHRCEVVALVFLGQCLTSFMNGSYQPTLITIYGSVVSSLTPFKRRLEQFAENVQFYRLFLQGSGTLVCGACDAPLLVWLVMPWEKDGPAIHKFVIRLAQSLRCNALVVAVPLNGSCGQKETVKRLSVLLELGRQRARAQRVVLGGSNLAGMFVLLYLQERYSSLRLGPYAAAAPETAHRAVCCSVILVDPFVGWEVAHLFHTNAPQRSAFQGVSDANRDSVPPNPPQAYSARSPPSTPISVKDRFKHAVMMASGSRVRKWFPPAIAYEAPPMVLLGKESGIWIEEMRDFNAKVDRFCVEENRHRVLFFPYSIRTTAAGMLVSVNCRVELERMLRMVEGFIIRHLSRDGWCAGVRHSNTPFNWGEPMERQRSPAGEVTIWAALPPSQRGVVETSGRR